MTEFPDVEENTIYNLDRLRRHFDNLDKGKLQQEFELKRDFYLEAKQILDQIAVREHSTEEFKEMIENLVGKKGKLGLWYSNGMYRHKGKIFDQQSKFRNLILVIKVNIDKRPSIIFNLAKKEVDKIGGVGPNFIGEIMMTYAPEKLANINRNPITVLKKEGDVDIKGHSSSFDGNDYEEYNSIIGEIAEALGLQDRLEADYFFNSIYQKVK